MRNGAKRIRTLELEREPQQQNPFKQYFEPIINPEAIELSSRKALGMNKTMVLSESMDELEQIAKSNGLTLKDDWLKVMEIYNRQNLNK